MPTPPATPQPEPPPLLHSFKTAQVDAQGQVIEERASTAPCFEEALGAGLPLRMIQIPAGTFVMGSPKTEIGHRSSESPQHPVTVATFLLSEFPVTRAQWQWVATAVAKVEQDLPPDPSRCESCEASPVESVSWDQAQEFCARLAVLTGRAYRLPSEAEWEYACRAQTTTPFHYGPTITTALANYRGTDLTQDGKTYGGFYDRGPRGDFRRRPTPYGTYPFAHTFGLSDMHGNVWEWCADAWHPNYQGAPPTGAVWSEASQVRRVARGGSWHNQPELCRSAGRFLQARMSVTCGSCGFGFRVAWTPP